VSTYTSRAYYDSKTGWRVSYLEDAAQKPPEWGLVLQNITHDGHNFAKDIRVVGLWIELEVVHPWPEPLGEIVVSKSKSFYNLGAPTFSASQIKTLVPETTRTRHSTPSRGSPYRGGVFVETWDYLAESDAALDFKEYFQYPNGNHVGFGVSAEFSAPTLFSATQNPKYLGLTVEEIFLFSPYGNHPVHEPTGNLSAARHHPLVRYTLLENPVHDASKRFTRVSSIRFDYRLHLYLDPHYYVGATATSPTKTQIGNQAGLFTDRDSKIAAAEEAALAFAQTEPGSGTSQAAFESVEKPLVLEVIAPGLTSGHPIFWPAGPKAGYELCWDNIHWWGARGPGEPLLRTPGSFHAAHLHWRWGRASSIIWPRGTPRMVTAGQPLVDPGIWMQTIWVAVTLNDLSLDPNRPGVVPKALSNCDWKKLFAPGLKHQPQDIAKGADIVLWYSAEVAREGEVLYSVADGYNKLPQRIPAAASGTIFIHGIFFAHDADPMTKFPDTGPLGVGSARPLYWPKDDLTIRTEKQWVRTAG
jgi:hypothetical protein